MDAASRPAQDALGPVLLVPGYGGPGTGLLAMAGRIEAATGRTAEVLTLAGDGTGDLSAQVGVLAAAVDGALAAGAPSVDVVGYSAGGVVAGLWVARDGEAAAKARRVITLGAPLPAPGWPPPPRPGTRTPAHRAAGSWPRAAPSWPSWPAAGSVARCPGCRSGPPTTRPSCRRTAPGWTAR